MGIPVACIFALFHFVLVERGNEDGASPEDQLAADKDGNGAAVYCEDCEMWLNGPTQWDS